MYEFLPYPKVLPPYKRTIVDSEFNLWAQEFRIRNDETDQWSVFDRSGAWLGRVTLPHGLQNR